MIIYTLKCEYNKYYVGKTNNFHNRYEKHCNGEGSAWTKRYKPIEIINTFETNDSYDEDKQTLKTMEKYGIYNVRGGSWTQIYLSKYEYQLISKMINSQEDNCFKCQKSGHFIKDCPDNINTTDVEQEVVNTCFKCGSIEHYAYNCNISCWDFLTRCFRNNHNNFHYIELDEN